MTGDAPRARRVARLPLSVALRWSIGAATLATVLLVALLWIQMARGNDPALGPKLAGQRTIAPDKSKESEGIPGRPQTAPAPTPAPVQTTTS
jgi:hypothetical protein